jgi:VanZ family protein
MERLLDPRMRSILFGLWCLAWLAVAVVLLMPLRDPPSFSHSDLIAHFLLFGCLAFGAVGFSHRSVELTLLAVATIAGGVGLEFAQGLVPSRTFDILDMGANAFGAMVGYGGALTVLQLVIRPADEARRAKGPVGA